MPLACREELAPFLGCHQIHLTSNPLPQTPQDQDQVDLGHAPTQHCDVFLGAQMFLEGVGSVKHEATQHETTLKTLQDKHQLHQVPQSSARHQSRMHSMRLCCPQAPLKHLVLVCGSQVMEMRVGH